MQICENEITQRAHKNSFVVLSENIGLNNNHKAVGRVERLAIIYNKNSDLKVRRIFAETAGRIGASVSLLNIEKRGEKKTLKKLIKGKYDVALSLVSDTVSFSNDLSKTSKDEGVVLVEMPGITIDMLASDVFLEKEQTMEQRANLLFSVLSGVSEIKITGDDGTDLTLEVDPSEKWLTGPFNFFRRGAGADGANLPGNEIYKNTLAIKTNGILVLHYLDSYVGQEIICDKPVVLKFYKGKIVSIEGAGSAQKLINYLSKMVLKDHDRFSCLRLSEVAIGLNYRARSYEEGIISTLEAEKAPRIHLAIGDSPVLDPNLANQRNFVSSNSHLDFVLPRVHTVITKHSSGEKKIMFGAAGSLERYGKEI